MSSSAKLRHEQEVDGREIEARIRSLLMEGRILEAKSLLQTAGDLVPVESKLREVLSPARVTRSARTDVDRSPEFGWLNRHEAEYQGKWVALVGEDLVASSDTLKELLAELAQQRFERKPLIHHLI